MKYSNSPVYPLFLAIAMGSILVACQSEDEETVAQFHSEGQITKIDRQTKSITTKSETWYCREDQALQEVNESNLSYHIENGKLYLWEKNSCEGSVYNGTNQDVVGKWDSEQIFVEDIRTVYAKAICDTSEKDGPSNGSTFTGAQVSAHIKETGIEYVYTPPKCMGEYVAMSYQDPSSPISVKKVGCDFVEIQNEKGQVARLEMQMTGNSQTMGFHFGQSHCKFEIPYTPDNVKPDCSNTNPLIQASMAYGQCIQNSGFYPKTEGDENFAE